MRGFHRLLLALAATVALGHVSRERQASLRGDDVDLGSIHPFEAYPGFLEHLGGSEFSAQSLESRNIQKRGVEASLTCAGVQWASPLNAGWIWKQAACVRPNTRNNRFTVDCMGAANHSEIIWGVKGRCGWNRVCTEYHGYNPAGIGAWDIYCADRSTLREWAIESKVFRETQQACSPNFVNKAQGHKEVQLALEVNVLDSKQSNRIAPSRVFYQLDGHKAGVERYNDPNVGSGILRIPWGGEVQACVEAKPGQVLWAMVTMTALKLSE